MKAKMLTVVAVLAILVAVYFANGCGNGPGLANCPTCGTQSGGPYRTLTVIPVPEHNPTGEPGGPFNSFDISWIDSTHHLDYVSDRIGLAVVVVDTVNNVAVNVLEGANGVTGVGDFASPCVPTAGKVVPPMQTALGNWTRFGCRNPGFGWTVPGFGANGLFGGFPGAQCCAARANGVNPLSGPDGEEVTADGMTLFSGNGSSAVVVWDLSPLLTNPSTIPNVIASIPTGQGPDYDGVAAPNPGFANPGGISGCVASANGRAFSDPTCGDLRADEMAYNNSLQILDVSNLDPALPFTTLIDMSGVVARTSNCQPFNPAVAYTPTNFPTCIIGQIYYDGSPISDSTVALDQAGAPCPDPSNFFPAGLGGGPVPSGASGQSAGTGGSIVPCHHGPIIDNTTGSWTLCNPTPQPGANCVGAVALAGLGGSVWNTTTNHLLITNASSTAVPNVGSVDEIDPHHMVATKGGQVDVGPVVIFSFPVIQCLPTSIVQGPGTHFLVGCADHDGLQFPVNEIVIDNPSPGVFTEIANIPFVGGVDEIWYNPTDNTYYVAARDMPNGPVMGVINAANNQWIVNVPTNSNSHSIAVDAGNNHVFVPSQSGGPCTTQSGNGCILVMARQ